MWNLRSRAREPHLVETCRYFTHDLADIKYGESDGFG